MKPRHIFLAILLSAAWGFTFVVIKLALSGFPPIFLSFLRFLVAAIPVVGLAKPNLPVRSLITLSSFWFVLQYSLLYLAVEEGLPAGLASVIVQAQALFTIAISGLLYKEPIRQKQFVAFVIAALGLLIIGSTVNASSGVSVRGLVLALAAALSWAISNLLLRRQKHQDMFALVSWLSLYALAPLFLISLAAEGPFLIYASISNLDVKGTALVLYMGVIATSAGCAAWGYLLRLYPASIVSPYALLVPVFGIGSAALVLDERMGHLRLIGTALVFLGLIVLNIPDRKTPSPSPVKSGQHIDL